ncbi:MAG: hypothetical protein ACRDT2_17065 [Natronosporangium sp.]
MPDHLELSGGAFELISAANRMITQGELTRSAMASAMSAVEAAEDDPGTFPPDEFTREFLANSYHVVPEGADLPASQAVKQHVAGGGGGDDDVGGVGGALAEFGQEIANAMWGYSATDDDNATNISGDGA